MGFYSVFMVWQSRRETERDRERETETERQRQRQRDRDRETETERQRQRDREREKGGTVELCFMSVCLCEFSCWSSLMIPFPPSSILLLLLFCFVFSLYLSVDLFLGERQSRGVHTACSWWTCILLGFGRVSTQTDRQTNRQTEREDDMDGSGRRKEGRKRKEEKRETEQCQIHASPLLRPHVPDVFRATQEWSTMASERFLAFVPPHHTLHRRCCSFVQPIWHCSTRIHSTWLFVGFPFRSSFVTRWYPSYEMCQSGIAPLSFLFCASVGISWSGISSFSFPLKLRSASWYPSYEMSLVWGLPLSPSIVRSFLSLHWKTFYQSFVHLSWINRALLCSAQVSFAIVLSLFFPFFSPGVTFQISSTILPSVVTSSLHRVFIRRSRINL